MDIKMDRLYEIKKGKNIVYIDLKVSKTKPIMGFEPMAN